MGSGCSGLIRTMLVVAPYSRKGHIHLPPRRCTTNHGFLGTGSVARVHGTESWSTKYCKATALGSHAHSTFRPTMGTAQLVLGNSSP